MFPSLAFDTQVFFGGRNDKKVTFQTLGLLEEPVSLSGTHVCT